MKKAPWLDIFRDPAADPSLLEAVRLWIVLEQPTLIDIDPAPLPTLDPRSAARTLETKIEEAIDEHDLPTQVHAARGSYRLSIDSWEGEADDDLWPLFINFITTASAPYTFRTCARCGNATQTKRDTALYCSPKCRVAAHAARQR